jgi:hypothetical protein
MEKTSKKYRIGNYDWEQRPMSYEQWNSLVSLFGEDDMDKISPAIRTIISSIGWMSTTEEDFEGSEDKDLLSVSLTLNRTVATADIMVAVPKIIRALGGRVNDALGVILLPLHEKFYRDSLSPEVPKISHVNKKEDEIVYYLKHFLNDPDVLEEIVTDFLSSPNLFPYLKKIWGILQKNDISADIEKIKKKVAG